MVLQEHEQKKKKKNYNLNNLKDPVVTGYDCYDFLTDLLGFFKTTVHCSPSNSFTRKYSLYTLLVGQQKRY